MVWKNVSFVISFLIIITVRTSTVAASSPKQTRSKRFAPYFPYQTGIAMAAAISVPVDNGRGDIFVSICIESNYNQPTYPALSPPPFQTIYGDTVDDRKLKDQDFDDYYAQDETVTQSTSSEQNPESETNRRKFKKLLDTMTRRKFFKLLEHKLKKYGFDGRSCLLKAICDASQYRYGQFNGVLGDIVHILFSPSTSEDEHLPFAYYKAEQHGRSKRCNEIYGKKCPIGIFDYITFT